MCCSSSNFVIVRRCALLSTPKTAIFFLFQKRFLLFSLTTVKQQENWSSGSSFNSKNAGSFHDPAAMAHTKSLKDEESDADWLKKRASSSVAQKKQSVASAEYLQKMIEEFPDLRPCVQEARRLLAGNDPEQLTRFQQAQFTDRLAMYTSGLASKRLMQTQREQSSAKKFTQDGTPTGENYWMEAGNILSSPSVPGYLKDELLEDLQKEREDTSPAFIKPTKEEFNPCDEVQYADHLRKQKKRLFDGVDIKHV